MMVMKRSRRHIVNEQEGKNDRIKRPGSKSLEFCSVIGLGKVNQTACFSEDNFSVVPLKTSREKSPCQDSQQHRTSACALQEADFQFTTPFTPTPGSAVSSSFLSLILALPSPLQAILPCPLSPFPPLCCFTQSYCSLFMIDNFFTFHIKQCSSFDYSLF